MIDEGKYQEILDDGLSLDHYFILCSIKNKAKLVDNKRIQGFLNLLIKKGYIENDELTEKGIEMVQNCEFSEIITIPDKQEQIDLGTWILRVHKACEDRILELTGKKQVRDKIDKKYWSFMCNARDLGKNLQKVIMLYKLSDYDKIEKTLLRHIDDCHTAKKWFPILYYYVYKEGKSQMVSDLDNESEDKDYVTAHKML